MSPLLLHRSGVNERGRTRKRGNEGLDGGHFRPDLKVDDDERRLVYSFTAREYVLLYITLIPADSVS